MTSNVLLFGWNRSIPGREQISAAHFQEFIGYLTGLAKSGAIQSFDPIFLEAHGGDLNGFVLIRGEPSRLDSLMSSKEWITHVTRALLHLEGAGAVRGVSGDGVAQRMALWTQHIPQ
jgi:hypothetical protein